jgi:hypothetical protein
MRRVPDATRDLQVFWDDRFYQFVLGIYQIWFFGLIDKSLPNWKATIIWLTVDYAPQIGCAFSLTLDTQNATHTLA